MNRTRKPSRNTLGKLYWSFVTAALLSLLVLVSLWLSRPVNAAAGDLDPTFGNGGKVTTDFPGENEGRAVAIQTDGKIVVAGGPDFGDAFLLTRYNADGSLDPSFGIAGQVVTGPWQSQIRITSIFALAIQPDGKIIAVGGYRFLSSPGDVF